MPFSCLLQRQRFYELSRKPTNWTVCFVTHSAGIVGVSLLLLLIKKKKKTERERKRYGGGGDGGGWGVSTSLGRGVTLMSVNKNVSFGANEVSFLF